MICINLQCPQSYRTKYSFYTDSQAESETSLIPDCDTTDNPEDIPLQMREDLENARKHPEKYSNLIVRVGGFSARYIELDDDIQLDILNRTLN